MPKASKPQPNFAVPAGTLADWRIQKTGENPEETSALVAAARSSPWNPKVRLHIQSAITSPESCGENAYNLAWYQILAWTFPDVTPYVGPIGYKESGRVRGGDKVIDIGVRVPVELEKTDKVHQLPVVLFELKDPKHWNEPSKRKKANDQIENRIPYLTDLLAKNKEFSDAVTNFHHVYIFSVFGFNFKLHRWGTRSTKLLPIYPPRDPTHDRDFRPYREDWAYNILTRDGYNIAMEVFRAVYEQLDACGMPMDGRPNFPETGIVLQSLKQFISNNSPVSTSYGPAYRRALLEHTENPDTPSCVLATPRHHGSRSVASGNPASSQRQSSLGASPLASVDSDAATYSGSPNSTAGGYGNYAQNPSTPARSTRPSMNSLAQNPAFGGDQPCSSPVQPSPGHNPFLVDTPEADRTSQQGSSSRRGGGQWYVGPDGRQYWLPNNHY